MNIVVKINEDNELVSIHCTDKDANVELHDYHACVSHGDATEEEMDREFEKATSNMHLIFDANTYWDQAFED